MCAGLSSAASSDHCSPERILCIRFALILSLVAEYVRPPRLCSPIRARWYFLFQCCWHQQKGQQRTDRREKCVWGLTLVTDGSSSAPFPAAQPLHLHVCWLSNAQRSGVFRSPGCTMYSRRLWRNEWRQQQHVHVCMVSECDSGGGRQIVIF